MYTLYTVNLENTNWRCVEVDHDRQVMNDKNY